MEKFNQLVKNVEIDVRKKEAWEDLITYSKQQLEQLYTIDLRKAIINHFKDGLPDVVEIEMGTEWINQQESYDFLSCVLVDGENDLKLKELLNDNFDIETLRNNPVIEFVN